VTYQRETIEETGGRLARQVLGSDNIEMIDLRAQRGVAFDRLGELEQFSEIKVYDGPEPAVISLTGAEVRRCSDDQFFIVVVSEAAGTGRGSAVRVIAPARMSIQPNGSDGHELVIGSGRAWCSILSHRFLSMLSRCCSTPRTTSRVGFRTTSVATNRSASRVASSSR
jgi:hypothetical protein